MKKIVSFLRKTIPWLAAIGIFAYLFHLYPIDKVIAAAKYVKIFPFIAFSLFYFFFMLLADSWAIKAVISRFSHQVSYKDVIIGRGASYLVMVINYPASQAAFAYYLKRRDNVPIFQAISIFCFIILIDLMWIIAMALCGSFFQDIQIGTLDLGTMIRNISLLAFGGFFLWIAFWRRWHEKIIGHSLRFAWLENLRSKKLFHVFSKATAKDYLKIALMRLPVHAVIICSFYILIVIFNAHVPFVKILGNIPIVFFIGTLPITPGGLGTTNAAMVELLSPYMTSSIFSSGKINPKELMFTLTLLWMFINYALKALVGFIFLKGVTKDLLKASPHEQKSAPESIPLNADHL